MTYTRRTAYFFIDRASPTMAKVGPEPPQREQLNSHSVFVPHTSPHSLTASVPALSFTSSNQQYPPLSAFPLLDRLD